MFIGAIAQKHMNESFEAYDSVTKEFVPNAFKGRLGLTDRFLSIYNRPTRKRQLYLRPDVVLPESMVFRHPSSKDVYILGQERQDARDSTNGGETYVKMCMVHLVTPDPNGSSGLAKQLRRVITGPPENPGWLVEQEIAELFIDAEFRTNTTEEGVYDTKIGNFYAWTPITSEVRQWDFFLLHGKRYRTVDSFTDIGMRGLRLDQEGDPRVDVVLTVQERVYDEIELAFVTTKVPYNVTVTIPENSEVADWADSKSTPQITVIIEFEHVGFKPMPSMTITYQDRSRIVKTVHTQAGEKQYRLTCE